MRRPAALPSSAFVDGALFRKRLRWCVSHRGSGRAAARSSPQPLTVSVPAPPEDDDMPGSAACPPAELLKGGRVTAPSPCQRRHGPGRPRYRPLRYSHTTRYSRHLLILSHGVVDRFHSCFPGTRGWPIFCSHCGVSSSVSQNGTIVASIRKLQGHPTFKSSTSVAPCLRSL